MVALQLQWLMSPGSHECLGSELQPLLQLGILNDNYPAYLVIPHLHYYPPEYPLAQHLLPFRIYRYPAYMIIPSTIGLFAQKRKPYRWVAPCFIVSPHIFTTRPRYFPASLFAQHLEPSPTYRHPAHNLFNQWEM